LDDTTAAAATSGDWANGPGAPDDIVARRIWGSSR